MKPKLWHWGVLSALIVAGLNFPMPKWAIFFAAYIAGMLYMSFFFEKPGPASRRTAMSLKSDQLRMPMDVFILDQIERVKKIQAENHTVFSPIEMVFHERQIYVLRLALQALTPASAWRPISEAKKDGTSFILCVWNGDRYHVGEARIHWNKKLNEPLYYWADGDEVLSTKIVGFQHLPPPPKAEVKP